MPPVLRRARRVCRSSVFWFGAFTAAGAYYWAVSTFIGLDDAYIYFRIAENLASTGRPVFNAGDAGFIATSPLWVALLAAGKWIVPALDLVVFAKGLYLLCLVLAAWFAYRLIRPRLAVGAPLIAAPFLLSHGLAGMAGGEIALLIAAFMGTLWAAAEERPGWTGIFIGAGILARGEFILVLPPVLAALGWSARTRGEDWRRLSVRLGTITGVAAAIVLGGHACLAWTFGDPLPHTLAVKRMQGLSGRWPLYPSGIWDGVRRALPGWRMAFIPLAVFGAGAFPRAAATMAAFTGLHALAYAAIKVPAYGWYYYDFVLFIPLLAFLGSARAVERASDWAAGRLARRTPPGRRVWAHALMIVGLPWMFPMHPGMFHPRFAPNAWSAEAPGERFRSYREAARRILPEVGPGDVVLASEIGILSYFLKGVEIRDNNGLASPGITVRTMNCWECAVDRFRPRFIVFPLRMEEAVKTFKNGGTSRRYRLRFIADPAAVRYAASVYEAEAGPGR